MTTDPTPKQQEEAREIVTAHARHSVIVRQDQLVDAIATALSSRDTGIREVLEGLSRVLKFKNGADQRCWCDKNWSHLPACLAARELWNRVQP